MSSREDQPPSSPSPVAQPAQSVVVVRQEGNGLGTAGFVCGLVGALLGLIPVFFWVSVPLGLLGGVFGAIGWSRARSDPQRGGKGLSIAGLVLGIVAVLLTVIWAILIFGP